MPAKRRSLLAAVRTRMRHREATHEFQAPTARTRAPVARPSPPAAADHGSTSSSRKRALAATASSSIARVISASTVATSATSSASSSDDDRRGGAPGSRTTARSSASKEGAGLTQRPRVGLTQRMQFAAPAEHYSASSGATRRPWPLRSPTTPRVDRHARGRRGVRPRSHPRLAARVRAANVAAIDPAPRFAAAFRAGTPGADVREGEAEALPWADREFDATLCQLVSASCGSRAGRRRWYG